MNNFECPVCHSINIDCGKDGYKTDREIKLEKEVKKYKDLLQEIKSLKESQNINDDVYKMMCRMLDE